MRPHAHPNRRLSGRRRLGSALAATLVLVAAAALVWRQPLAISAGGISAGLDAAAAEAASASPSLVAAPGAATTAGPGVLGSAVAGDDAPAVAATASPPSASPEDGAATAPPGLIVGTGRDHADLVPTTPAPPSTLTGYAWPIAHPRLTLPFGPTAWGTRLVDGQLFHDGVDLATFCNDRIMAAHDGVVLAAGRRFDDDIGWVGSLAAYYQRIEAKHLWIDLPNVVIVDDGNGYRSIYAHMWKLTVRAGQRVTAGQLIGYEGMTGHATGCHLHYGLFSPAETATFGTEPKAVKTWHEPPAEIARIDPLLVLPFRKGIGGVMPTPGAAGS